jgi:hypothetical protein
LDTDKIWKQGQQALNAPAFEDEIIREKGLFFHEHALLGGSFHAEFSEIQINYFSTDQ